MYKSLTWGTAIKNIRNLIYSGDLKTYDFCKVQVCSNGCIADLNVGELWVHYEVCLRIPKQVSLTNGTVVSNSIRHFYVEGTSIGVSENGFEECGNWPFLSQPYISQQFFGYAYQEAVPSFGLASFSGNTLTFPVGMKRVNWSLSMYSNNLTHDRDLTISASYYSGSPVNNYVNGNIMVSSIMVETRMNVHTCYMFASGYVDKKLDDSYPTVVVFNIGEGLAIPTFTSTTRWFLSGSYNYGY